jgi:hypothetical protein
MPDEKKPPEPLVWESDAANDPAWTPVVVPMKPDEAT